jgi:hypothetical protein
VSVSRSREHLAERCRAWNANHARQVSAGRARAAELTVEYQRRAGNAAWNAFSTRFRAQQGLAPLSAEPIGRYLAPEDVRYLGSPLAPALRERTYRAWSASDFRHVSAWLRDDPPHNPHGLWAQRPPALA